MSVVRLTIGLLLIPLFEGCSAPIQTNMPPGAGRDITFKLKRESASSIEVVGSFNDWRLGSTPMLRHDLDNWSITLKLQPGTYQYQFVVDGRFWMSDPNAVRSVSDGFGRTNSLLIILNSAVDR